MDSCIYTNIFNLIPFMPPLHIQNKNHKLNIYLSVLHTMQHRLTLIVL